VYMHFIDIVYALKGLSHFTMDYKNLLVSWITFSEYQELFILNTNFSLFGNTGTRNCSFWTPTSASLAVQGPGIVHFEHQLQPLWQYRDQELFILNTNFGLSGSTGTRNCSFCTPTSASLAVHGTKGAE
jgi:hypothetical protein